MHNQTLERVKEIEARVSSLVNSIQKRAWKLAATVEIPRDGCCLHNASIDDNMTGWCFQAPERLKVAKRATRMIDESWEVSSLGDRIVRRLFNNDESFGTLKYDVSNARLPNMQILFGKE